MRQAPSMTGLRVLEAVLRLGTLSAAARELCVTPAAVSHRLRDLEALGGPALLAREGGRFVATPRGASVLSALGDAFTRIRAADAILTAGDTTGLRILASYSFAVLWLAPRLSRFEALHPEVELILEPSHSPTAARGDIAILHAVQPPAEPGWTHLFADRCAVIGRADHPLLARPGTGPKDVLEARRVTIKHGQGAPFGEFSWHDWTRAQGLALVARPSGPVVTAEHLAVDLILEEEALALVSLVNASRLLGEGRLGMLSGSEVATGCSYWLYNAAPTRPVADAFVSWLTRQFANGDPSPAPGAIHP